MLWGQGWPKEDVTMGSRMAQERSKQEAMRVLQSCRMLSVAVDGQSGQWKWGAGAGINGTHWDDQCGISVTQKSAGHLAGTQKSAGHLADTQGAQDGVT